MRGRGARAKETNMPIPSQHIFVCINEREPNHARSDCASKGAVELHKALKVAVKAEPKLAGKGIRVNKAGCLDTCEQGCSMVIYPQATWLGNVTQADIPAIISHLSDGDPVNHLRIDQIGQD